MNKSVPALFSKRLWINVVLIVILIFALVFGTLMWLGRYTRHGQSVGVPDLRGMPIAQLDELLGSNDLTYEITDSIYSDTYPRGTVIQQSPNPDHRVKEGRTIYLTVNSMLPEMVEMPGLSGKSRRIAIPMLEISGLELEALTYKPDESCTDCVLDQLYQGRSIAAGQQIRKGEKITLVLGQRSNELTTVPRLLGLSYQDAYGLLNAYSLNMGEVLSCQGCTNAEDSTNAFVISQSPEQHSNASLGSFVDLYLSVDSAQASEFFIPTDTSAYEIPNFD